MTSSTEATLSGSFSGASSVPSEVGFYWGTSSNSLTNKAVADAASSTSGTFTAKLTGLTEGETYVYQAYAIVSGTGSHSSETQIFYASGTKYFKAGESSSSSAFCGWLELPGGTVGTKQTASEGFKYVSEDLRYITDVLKANGKRNYTHYFDTKMYTSLWTAYPVYPASMGSLGRPGNWHSNPNIDTKYQINVWDGSYNAGGDYSRGHLIPNGSRNGIRAMQLQAFYATNSVPQIQNTFNGTIWSRLENALQAIGQADTVYVVTGVAFNKVGGSESISYISPKHDSKKCPVPNYFYKVALKVKRSGSAITSASAIGIWMEHRSYSSSEDYDEFAVSVDQIEEWTGFDFFVNLPESLQLTAEKNSSWSTFKNFK